MMTLAAFTTLCEAHLDIWPNVELFRWLIYFKTQMAGTILVVCETASFYTCKTADFPGLRGKESCKKWQRSFFYVKNLRKGLTISTCLPSTLAGPVSKTIGVPHSLVLHWAW
jgi:hypothetical protein